VPRHADTSGDHAAAGRTEDGELLAFERLLAELSASFVGLDAERIDGAVDDALRRIARTLRIDRATLTLVSPLTGRIETAHSWAESGFQPLFPIVSP
jgi:formate hydrogenlyase transcriptional activator